MGMVALSLPGSPGCCPVRRRSIRTSPRARRALGLHVDVAVVHLLLPVPTVTDDRDGSVRCVDVRVRIPRPYRVVLVVDHRRLDRVWPVNLRRFASRWQWTSRSRSSPISCCLQSRSGSSSSVISKGHFTLAPLLPTHAKAAFTGLSLSIAFGVLIFLGFEQSFVLGEEVRGSPSGRAEGDIRGSRCDRPAAAHRVLRDGAWATVQTVRGSLAAAFTKEGTPFWELIRINLSPGWRDALADRGGDIRARESDRQPQLRRAYPIWDGSRRERSRHRWVGHSPASVLRTSRSCSRLPRRW